MDEAQQEGEEDHRNGRRITLRTGCGPASPGVQRGSRRADSSSAAAMSFLAGFDLTPLRLLVMLALLSAVSGVGH